MGKQAHKSPSSEISEEGQNAERTLTFTAASVFVATDFVSAGFASMAGVLSDFFSEVFSDFVSVFLKTTEHQGKNKLQCEREHKASPFA
jgi:hypothetical protein